MTRYKPSLRLSAHIPAAMAVLLAAGASLTAARIAVDRIEQQSLADVNRVLEVDGHDWVQVAVDGLQVQLSGEAVDEATRFRALTIAGTAVDATRVIDGMAVRVPDPIEPPRFSIEILRNDDGIALFGLIPLSTDRDALIARAEDIAGEGGVTDLMETADFTAPRGWDGAVDYAMRALDDLPRSKISVAADRVAITATTDSAQLQRRAETTLARLAPDGVNLSLNISAPRPVIAPFTLRFLIGPDGPRFDACSADTDEARERILAAAAEAGLEGNWNCTVGLGVPTVTWADATVAGIGALAEIGQGTITFSNADVTLVAAETTEQDVFDRVVGELTADLPSAFSLHAVLPEPVVVDGTGESTGTPEFVATRSPEGLVQLRGRVTDDLIRDAVESYANARFGAANVYPATRLDAELPTGWPIRVLAGLEALSMLNNGSVVVQPDYVRVQGDTGNQEAAAEISRLLSEQLGGGQEYDISVVYEEALDPVAALPTPEECVEKINVALTDRKITFAPGSSNIDVDALETIDKVAEVLRACQTVKMEIGGHTDSQGRESMNLNLSQARADAVLNAIMARRVLIANLSAQGYGEAQPIADNDTEEGRERNRRIEFRLILPEEADAGAGEDVAETPASEAAETDETGGE